MPEGWDGNVRRDQLNQRPVGGKSRHVRVNAVADVGRIRAVAGYLGWLVGGRRSGLLNRNTAVAVVGLGHQDLARRAQQGESGGKGEDPAWPKPGPLAHGREYRHLGAAG